MNDTATPPFLSIRILQALGLVEHQLEQALEPMGLSLAKLNVLSKLASAGAPVSLGCLADRCSCVRSNITQLVDRLEAEKLVVRSDDPRDRRSVRAELTAAGRARHDAGIAVLAEADQRILARVPEPLRDNLTPILDALRDEE
jgi:DNA-binding MarR family transcriptional regulator